jgi:DNA-binding LytR/AlgR family response regulator
LFLLGLHVLGGALFAVTVKLSLGSRDSTDLPHVLGDERRGFAGPAFEEDAIDYLLKPFHRERFHHAIEKARFLRLAMRTARSWR